MPPARSSHAEWTKFLVGIWRWNPHRHELIISLIGGVFWAHICWAYVYLRSGTPERARLPLFILSIEATLVYFAAFITSIYIWTKVRFFALLRVLLSNFFLLILGILAIIWMGSSMLLSPAGVIFLSLIAIRGILVHSWDTLNQSMLALTLIATLVVVQVGSAPHAAWLIGLGVITTLHALFCGLEPGKGHALPWILLHLCGYAMLANACALLVLQHPDAGLLMGIALAVLTPAGVYMAGSHVHQAFFLNCAVAAGDLDKISDLEAEKDPEIEAS